MLSNSTESNRLTLGFMSYCLCTPYRILLPICGEKAGQKEKSDSAFYKSIKMCSQLYRTVAYIMQWDGAGELGEGHSSA